MPALKVSLVIPTRNGAEDLDRLLASLSTQTMKPDVFVIDSDSLDATADVARKHNAMVHGIPVSEFNHGGTRQLIVNRHPDYDVYVFMTQDAYLADEQAIERIVAPFADPSVGAVCGRQLPHLDAKPLAAHARLFNYPPESRVKSLNDVAELGIKTPFISNSFAAYRREALADVGGFPSHVILSEDMYVAKIGIDNYMNTIVNIKSFMDDNNRAPNYAGTTVGDMRYENLIYTYSQILNYYNVNGALPKYVTVYPWSVVTGSSTVTSNENQIIATAVTVKII